jgi:hypothetical protein
VVSLDALPVLPGAIREGHRLINSKFPPIRMFDDVASASEFDALYELQALTNPRLQTEIGNLALIEQKDIPFGIPGCSYATAPFTHVNPNGSRFGDGAHGVLYIADTIDTAIAEVRHHQDNYWRNVPDLGYERFVFRGLTCTFDEGDMVDGVALSRTEPVYAPDDYAASRALGQCVRERHLPGLRYHSVRHPGAMCWALMSPKPVSSIVQTAHYEMVWSGAITSINRLSSP